MLTLFPKATIAILAALCTLPTLSSAQVFRQTNLVTDDQSVHKAAITDPKLVNVWGLSYSPTGAFWVSNNGSGTSTLYAVNPTTNAAGIVPLTVTIPGAGSVTGQVFNTTGGFHSDNFLFVSEDGTVSGWRGGPKGTGNTAETFVAGSTANVYKGSAIATVGGHGYFYEANFRTGNIDVLKGDAGAPNLSGNFKDSTLPTGYAPFNIQKLGSTLYVTYALQDAFKHDDVAGLGNGFVDAFDLNGNFLARVGSQGTLDSPWGLALAPSSFGAYAGDLLVGNFGDGRINVFNPTTDTYLGQLQDETHHPIAIDGLWGLIPGNNGGAGSAGNIYFSAGPNGESHGVFGSLQAVPGARQHRPICRRLRHGRHRLPAASPEQKIGRQTVSSDRVFIVKKGLLTIAALVSRDKCLQRVTQQYLWRGEGVACQGVQTHPAGREERRGGCVLLSSFLFTFPLLCCGFPSPLPCFLFCMRLCCRAYACFFYAEFF